MKHLSTKEIEAMKVEFPVEESSKEPKGPHDRLIECLQHGADNNDDYVRFNMNSYYNPAGIHECGTTACIAGFACILMGINDPDEISEIGGDSLIDFLGVSEDEADDMAHARSESRQIDLCEVRAKHAIRMLEIHRDTGKVDWAAAMEA